MPQRPYDPTNWYWRIAGNNTTVFSSSANSFISVTDADYLAWGQQATLISSNDLIKTRIDILENQISDRRVREAILGMDVGWMASLNTQILSLRAQLQ